MTARHLAALLAFAFLLAGCCGLSDRGCKPGQVFEMQPAAPAPLYGTP